MNKEKSLKTLKIAFFAAVIATLLFMCRTYFFPVDDPDVFWHLVIGRWIVSHGELPVVEHWNAFGLGQPFRAYSWSSEVTYALIHRHFGFGGLRVFQAALALCLLALSFVTWRKISRSLVLSLFLISLFIPVVDPFVGPRPQVVTFILFSLIPLIAASIRRRGITVKNGLFTGLLFAVWANTHLAMILGLGYLGGLIFAWDKRRAVLTLQALFIGFLGTFATPYFGGTWLTFLTTSSHVGGFRKAIVEFEALSPSHFMFPWWLLASALVGLTIFFRRKRVFSRRHLFETLVTLSFLALGVYAVKFLAFSALAAFTYLARFATPLHRHPWLREYAPFLISNFSLSSLGRCFQKPLTALCTIWALMGGGAFVSATIQGLSGEDIFPGTYSVAALDEVLKKSLKGPVLTDFSNGGYLMFRLSDDAGNVAFPVAIDGRTNILSREEVDSYYCMEGVREGWRSFIERYNPGTIVWPTTRNEELVKALARSDDWCEILSGEGGGDGYAVFVRCSEAQEEAEGKP